MRRKKREHSIRGTGTWTASTAAEAIATGWQFFQARFRAGRSRTDDPATERTLVTDGSGEIPAGEDPEETPFIWGPTRERPGPRGRGRGRDRDQGESPAAAFEAIEDRLEDIADTADHLSILATNANLKLARDEPRGLADVAYDVEADARALHRALEDVESRVERLRARVDSSPSERSGVGEPDRADRPRPPTGTRGGDRESPAIPAEVDRPEGRAGVQLPPSDRGPTGPWRVAGVDLTDWPGHLARVDFERIRERVARSETIAAGRVPRDVAEFSLDDRELSFDALLALEAASGLGSQNPESGGPSDDDG